MTALDPIVASTTVTTDTTSTSIINTTSINSTSPATSHEDSHASAELIVVTIVVVVAVAALIFLVVLFSNKLRYSKWFIRLLSVRKRHSSTSSSHRPLEPDEVEDLPPPRTERELFSIGDHDDIDTRLGTAPDDGYFFDEIYERSAFVDETTNTSIKELKISRESEDIPDILFKPHRH